MNSIIRDQFRYRSPCEATCVLISVVLIALTWQSLLVAECRPLVPNVEKEFKKDEPSESSKEEQLSHTSSRIADPPNSLVSNYQSANSKIVLSCLAIFVLVTFIVSLTIYICRLRKAARKEGVYYPQNQEHVAGVAATLHHPHSIPSKQEHFL